MGALDDRPDPAVDGTALTLRDAAAGDAGRVAEIQHRVPGSELVGLFGSADRARRFGLRQTTRRGVVDERRPVIVACRDERVVGFAQWSIGDVDRTGPRDVLDALAVVGVRGLLRFPRKLKARSRVHTPVPPNALYLAEIHVDPGERGAGVGGALLDAVIARAERLGRPLVSLTTTIDNPARRLYERHGFVVIDEKRDAEYEAISGSPGRVRMDRDRRGASNPPAG
jgi:ribosomal protein S18 acetylase RimI-like enzyme